MLNTLFSFAFPQTIQQKVNKSLDSFNPNSNQALPQNYQNLIYSHQNFSQSFGAVVGSLPRASTPSAIIKIFTIIFKGIRNKECTIEALQYLQKLQTPLLSQIQQKDISWINQITIATKSYLARLPSLHEAFQRAIQSKGKKLNNSYLVFLSDLYFILNASALLFPAVTNCMNNIGRYYSKTYLYFTQFYKVVKDQILIGYQYIENIISTLKENYKNYDIIQLECFVKTIASIQLYCDRVQQFTMNKYFNGKGPNKKIYFKEEEIDQISYFIQSSNNKGIQSQGSKYTNQEDLFGDFLS